MSGGSPSSKPSTAVDAPTNLVITGTSASTVGLAWTNHATNATAIIVGQGLDAASIAPIATLAVTETTFTVANLSPLTRYAFNITTVNIRGVSAPSNTVTATTLTAPIQSPNAPSILAATATSHDTIVLTFVDNATDEDGTEIERTLSGGTFQRIITLSPNVTTYSDIGLTAQTRYEYRARTVNMRGLSPYSNTTSATTNDAAPRAPTNLAVSAVRSTTVTLN